MNDGLCIAIGANYYFMCKSNRRYVGTDVQARLAEVTINSRNVVHSIRISTPNHVLGYVLLTCISGALM